MSHISKTQIDMYLRCEEQYAWRYGRGAKKPPGAALTVGIAFDDGVSASHENRIATGESLSADKATEVAVTRMEQDKDATMWDTTGETFTKCKDRMPLMLSTYMDDIDPHVQPAVVQAEEELSIVVKSTSSLVDFLGDDGPSATTTKEVTILGYKDVVEVDGTVRDTKTAARMWPRGAERTKLDPLIYTLYPEDVPSRFVFDIVTKAAKPKAEMRTVNVTPTQKRKVKNLIVNVADRMADVRDDPDSSLPTGYGGNLCSKRYCGFWQECQQRHGLPVKD